MSRIGRKPVPIPEKVKVDIHGNAVKVAGPLGELNAIFPAEVPVTIDKNIIHVGSPAPTRQNRGYMGLVRALLNNMVRGVTKGYEKKLEVVGVGYLCAIQKGVLQLRVGLANELQVPIPEGLKVTVPDQQHVVIQGVEKQKVHHFAAAVRALRKPEPYKGKGIRFLGEVVRRKQGKAMVK